MASRVRTLSLPTDLFRGVPVHLIGAFWELAILSAELGTPGRLVVDGQPLQESEIYSRCRATRDQVKDLSEFGLVERDVWGEITLPVLFKQAEKLHKDAERKKPIEEPTSGPDVPELMEQIAEHYRKYHPRAKTPKSFSPEYKAIAARLKEGWELDELQAAIDGCHKHPHNCGQNERQLAYQSLGLIFRDSDHVQRFIEYNQNGKPRAVLSLKSQTNMSAAASFLAKRGA